MKNIEKEDFDESLEFAAPKYWSKHTTVVTLLLGFKLKPQGILNFSQVLMQV